MPVLWELLQIPFSFSLIQPFSFSIIYGFQHELIWVEWTSLYLPRKGRKSNGYLSLKSEQKQINSHKVAQHDDTTNRKRLSKNMYHFQKIWNIKEKKKNFFSICIYENEINISLLKSYEKDQLIFWKKKQERKKAKRFFSIYFFFLYVYIKMN